MIAFIINFNRLTLPMKMADWLSERNVTPVFVDNNSDYKPLLEYYQTCKYDVIRMNYNFGHRVIWDKNLAPNERYIVTDSDLDLSKVPDDFLQVLHEGLDRYPQFDKCGLSLEINDLPDGNPVKEIYEAKYWTIPLDKMYFNAPVDTTFALYKANHYFLQGIRTNRPYTAKHVPWYYKDFESLSDEEKYYFTTANESSSGKKRIIP